MAGVGVSIMTILRVRKTTCKRRLRLPISRRKRRIPPDGSCFCIGVYVAINAAGLRGSTAMVAPVSTRRNLHQARIAIRSMIIVLRIADPGLSGRAGHGREHRTRDA